MNRVKNIIVFNEDENFRPRHWGLESSSKNKAISKTVFTISGRILSTILDNPYDEQADL